MLSEDIAKNAIKKAVANSKVSYQQKVAAQVTSEGIAYLYECVYSGVVDYFKQELKNFMQFPKAVFLEKLWKSFHDLTNEFANFGSPEMFRERFFDDCFDKVAFHFGYRCKGKNAREKWKDIDDYLWCKWDETIKALDSCSSKIKDKELAERTHRYLDSNRKVMEAVRSRKGRNGDSSKEPGKIKADVGKLSGLGKSLKENADKLDEYIRMYTKTNIVKLRNSLRENQKVTLFYLQLMTDAASQNLVIKNRQRPSNVQMKKIAEKREKFLTKVWKKYSVMRSSSAADVSVAFLELLREMHITEENSQDEFKTYLDQAISGLSVSETVLELAKSNYEESIADIVMCVNLDLGVNEYLAFIFDMYETADNRFLQSVPRFAVVIAYLIYVKEKYKDMGKTGGDETAMQKLAEARQGLVEEFQKCVEKLPDDTKSSLIEICKELQKQIIDVQKSKLFRIAFRRAFQLRDRFRFADTLEGFGKIQCFVRKNLEMKLSDNKNEDVNAQNDEIAFILQYYYKNRIQYANKKIVSTKEGFSDGLQPGV
ncbi:MAG: hypothetical protein NC409_03940 [Clostridium sp.]|nr:hypothetical protein [Clostridium sp.]